MVFSFLTAKGSKLCFFGFFITGFDWLVFGSLESSLKIKFPLA